MNNLKFFLLLKLLIWTKEIIYIYQGNSRKYKVIYVDVIKETDWQNLKETVDNRITLITCVEDKPEFRRCVQAVEIKEE